MYHLFNELSLIISLTHLIDTTTAAAAQPPAPEHETENENKDIFKLSIIPPST